MSGVSRRSQVPAFEVMTILDRVASLRAAGRDVISLCAGEPVRGAPSAVNRAAAQQHSRAAVFGYTPALGIAPLRERIAQHYHRWYGLDVDPANVALTTGSSGAFLLAFLAAFDAGDRVAIARPGYPAYRNLLTALGCEVVDIDCGPAVRFQPTIELLDAAHDVAPLRGLILASPANPTGTMVSRGELGVLQSWCDENDVCLVSDEIYHGVTYPVAAQAHSRGSSAWEFSRSGMVVSSFSKYWGMTGWRLGWTLVPDSLVGAVDSLAGNLALCPPAPPQYAALEAFTEESYAECDAAVGDFARARALLLDNAARLDWGVAAPADGAFYYYADLGAQLERWGTSGRYAAALLDSVGVALTPGNDFDDRAGHRSVRLSFAAGPDNIGRAIERILDFQSS